MLVKQFQNLTTGTQLQQRCKKKSRRRQPRQCHGILAVEFVKKKRQKESRLRQTVKREFVPRDQLSSLLVIYCSLFLHLNF